MKISVSNTLALLSVALFSAVLVGCVTQGQMRFSEYTGQDASSSLGTWPIGSGSMAETSYAVPVYRGWPEKPYQVLGSLSFPDPNAEWNEDFFRAAAKHAKNRKGDAIIIRKGAEFGVSQIAGARSNPLSVVGSTYQTTALVIRWLTPQEVRDRDLLLDELLKRFATNDPRVSANRTVAELVVIFLVSTGCEPRSPQLAERFMDTMGHLTSRASESLSGEWIFRTSMSFSTVLAEGSERSHLGLALVSTDGENVTIVSTAGAAEINFTGTLLKGRLSGQIGVGGVSAKCDGAATPEKISISFQSLTPDGTVRGNVVLQRLAPKQNNYEKAKPDSGVGTS